MHQRKYPDHSTRTTEKKGVTQGLTHGIPGAGLGIGVRRDGGGSIGICWVGGGGGGGWGGGVHGAVGWGRLLHPGWV